MPIMERDLSNSNFSLRFGSRVGFHKQMRSCYQCTNSTCRWLLKSFVGYREDSNDFTHIFYFYVFLLLFVAVEKTPILWKFPPSSCRTMFFLQLQTATAEVRGTKTHWRDQARKTCCLIWRGNAGFSVVDEFLADDEIRDPKIHVKKESPKLFVDSTRS